MRQRVHIIGIYRSTGQPLGSPTEERERGGGKGRNRQTDEEESENDTKQTYWLGLLSILRLLLKQPGESS